MFNCLLLQPWLVYQSALTTPRATVGLNSLKLLSSHNPQLEPNNEANYTAHIVLKAVNEF